MASDYLVTVCAECLRASCWHGEEMCERSRGAGTVERLASWLRWLGREHPSNFDREKILAVCGEVREAPSGWAAFFAEERERDGGTLDLAALRHAFAAGQRSRDEEVNDIMAELAMVRAVRAAEQDHAVALVRAECDFWRERAEAAERENRQSRGEVEELDRMPSGKLPPTPPAADQMALYIGQSVNVGLRLQTHERLADLYQRWPRVPEDVRATVTPFVSIYEGEPDAVERALAARHGMPPWNTRPIAPRAGKLALVESIVGPDLLRLPYRQDLGIPGGYCIGLQGPRWTAELALDAMRGPSDG